MIYENKNGIPSEIRFMREWALHLFALTILVSFSLGVSGCSRVLKKDREFLSDPILRPVPDPLGNGLESHNRPRREGGVGGASGSGGGCGC
jgi:hypothetical protein